MCWKMKLLSFFISYGITHELKHQVDVFVVLGFDDVMQLDDVWVVTELL